MKLIHELCARCNKLYILKNKFKRSLGVLEKVVAVGVGVVVKINYNKGEKNEMFS